MPKNRRYVISEPVLEVVSKYILPDERMSAKIEIEVVQWSLRQRQRHRSKDQLYSYKLF